jgi:regulatory protein YycI of two-component signal transduction system YycFG
MKKNILIIVFIVVGVFVASQFSDYNRNKSISACVIAQKKKAENFDINKAKKLCEKVIKKK